MSTMELLEIPGMDQSEELFEMSRKSRERMKKNAACQRIAAAKMSMRLLRSKGMTMPMRDERQESSPRISLTQ